MAKVTTKSGDTWDILAKRIYDNEMFMDILLKANFHLNNIVIFPAGVEIEAPEIDVTSPEYVSNLPPWKRG